MRGDRSAVWCLSVAVSFLLAGRTLAQEDDSSPDAVATLRAGALPADFEFDGKMHEPAWWAATDSIADLITVEPEEGGVPAGRTTIKVLADQNDIVVGVRCRDREPEGIVSFSKARDSDLEKEDHIVVVFDTFLDARSGYVFAVNPSGARFDALVVGRENVNSDWDTVWEAKTARDSTGWSVEIRIPILSLGFKKEQTTWGFNVQRRVQRLQETSRWSGANLDYEIFQTRHCGLLTELPDFDLGVGTSVRSAVVGRVRGTPRKPGPGIVTDGEADISLDVTQRLGPNLSSALTVNTDFAETEVDVRQINLTRFPLFFPEKRTFFQEGADIFAFGLGLDEENLLPFFSRRIGLSGRDEEEQTAIPINAGGKIVGRVGGTNLGALVVNTRKVDGFNFDEGLRVDVPTTTMGAVRISHNILDESSVGMTAGFGDQLGRSGSWSAGVDFTFATSNFRGNKNLVIGTWGLLDDRADLGGDKSAHGVRIEYPNDLLDANLTSIHIGDGFDPSLGFVPRPNVHIWDLGLEINPRPSWSFVRQMFHELSFTLFNARNNSRWESYSGTIKPLDWLLESGDRFEAGIEPEGDRLPEVFEIAADVDLPRGSYEWTRYFLRGQSAEKRRLSAEVRWDAGSYYSGRLHSIEFRLAVRPSALYTLELTGERHVGKVDALIDDYDQRGSTELIARRFTEELYGVRLQLNLTADLQLSSLTQYDTQSRELGTNNRMRWTFDPLGDVFVVFNHNVYKRKPDNRWLFASNELPVKIQYARRF